MEYETKVEQDNERLKNRLQEVELCNEKLLERLSIAENSFNTLKKDIEEFIKNHKVEVLLHGQYKGRGRFSENLFESDSLVYYYAKSDNYCKVNKPPRTVIDQMLQKQISSELEFHVERIKVYGKVPYPFKITKIPIQ